MDKRIKVGIGILIVIILLVFASEVLSSYQGFNYVNHNFEDNFTMDVPESFHFSRIVNDSNLVSYESNKVIVSYYDLTNKTERVYCDSNTKSLVNNSKIKRGNLTIYKDGGIISYYNCFVYSDDNNSCVRVQYVNEDACYRMANSVKFI
ncbi:MAG: hypothetical protein ACOX01_01020 [Methanobrevibacter boviskoreani]|uniref:hypothetical protein n=1 Tax=Methanobrevibacter boviskoreani TaxID=1348249 RepID=UPI0023A82F30|nr:hypothetical protein [Methanobrevibacter boviskoreani]MCI6775726.1 hypothetical protein [Methanobrevibacter boviskoreani]MCI6931188.1 hypothetical protein [Methanobrevibacter boviskoreani]MDY5615204.1 hypothetical protein [Methanobrevibacter boviskoreani]